MRWARAGGGRMQGRALRGCGRALRGCGRALRGCGFWLVCGGALGACATEPVNQPPVAVAGPDQRVRLGASGSVDVTLDGSASFDPDGDPIEWRWTALRAPSGLSLLGEARTRATPELRLTTPGLYFFEIIVTDGVAESAPDHTSVFVVSE